MRCWQRTVCLSEVRTRSHLALYLRKQTLSVIELPVDIELAMDSGRGG